MINFKLIANDGLPSLTIKLHGLKPQDFTRFLSHSFSNKTQVIPNPKGDSFSSSAGSFLAGVGDHVCLFTQPPGLNNWRQSTHLSKFVTLHEFDCQIGPNHEKGYPFGSINEAFLGNDTFKNFLSTVHPPGTLITTFPDDSTKRKAATAGLQMVQKSNPALTNSKSEFHLHNQKYAYRTCPSFVIKAGKDIVPAIKKLSGYKQGVWVKFDGSGGDTVVRVPVLTDSTLKNAIHKINLAIRNSFANGNFSPQEKEKIIKSMSTIPQQGIIVEADVRNFGEIVVNGSNAVTTDIAGNSQLCGLYSQITQHGVFCGSRDLFADPIFQRYLSQRHISPKTIVKLLERNARKVARLATLLQFFGLSGQDFFLVETPGGKLEVYNTELNGRISNSAVANFAAVQARVDHFLMLNIKAKTKECNTISDLKTLMTVNGVDYLNHDPQDGAVWPIAFKSRWKNSTKQKQILVEGSKELRVVILGSDPGKIDAIKEKISSRCDFI